MTIGAGENRVIRFGVFEIHPKTGELRKNGVRLRLQDQPFRVLVYLVERPGQVVTREELQKALWPSDVFVDFDHALSTSINKIREVLGDSPATPRFVETVPRRGYRFIAPIQGQPAQPAAKPRHLIWLAAGLVLVTAGLSGLVWWSARTQSASPRYRLTQLTRDSGLTMDPALSPDGKMIAFASDRSGEGNLDIWVQHVAGRGNPVRLTSHQANDQNPSFSADGSQIVFDSERDESGIYVVPVLGGPERLLARHGRFPRFSPDGKWVAYSVGTFHSESWIQIVPASGGEPRKLDTTLGWTAMPVWSPDGSRLMFWGSIQPRADFLGWIEWWVAPVTGGKAVPIGAVEMLRESGIRHFLVSTLVPGYFDEPVWSPDGAHVLFAGQQGDSVNLWRAALTPGRWRLASAPQKLTSGTAEMQPSAAGSRIAFSSLRISSDLWEMPLDAAQGKALGPPRRLTDDLASDTGPSVSADGKKLAFLSNRTGLQTAWVMELETGNKYALTADRVNRAHMSPDGRQVLLYRDQWGKPLLSLIDASGGIERKICEDCGNPLGWSPDGRKVLFWRGQPIREVAVEVDSGKQHNVVTHPEANVYSGRYSPDGGWIAFCTYSPSLTPLHIAALRGGAAAPESEWIYIDDTQATCRPNWSPDGNLLYYLTRRDGFLCLWAQRLHPSTKRPAGAPFPVHHVHEAHLALTPQAGHGFTSDKWYFSLEERKANIWLAEPE